MGRAERADKRRGVAADRRRAQAYVAQLAWLERLDGNWRDWTTGAQVELDGAGVALARRTAHTALREHRSALVRIVGDVDAWWAIVDAKLAWCGARAHGRDTGFDPRPFLPPRTLRRLATATPRDLAWRAAIAWVARPAVLDRVLAWLAAHEAALAELPPDERVRLAMLFARWAVDDEPGAAPAVDELLALIILDAPEPKAARAVALRVEARLRSPGATLPPRPPEPRSAARILAWLPKLAAFEPQVRRRAFALLGAAALTAALRPWVDWERSHAGLIERANQLAAATFASPEEREVPLERVLGKLEAAHAAAPIAASLGDAILEVNMLAHGPFEREHPAIVRLLAALPASSPGGPSARARMLLHCARAAACAQEERVEWVWDALAAALEGGASPAILDHWRTALTTDERVWFDEELARFLARASDAARAVRVMVDLAARGGAAEVDDGPRAAAFARGGLTDERILADVVFQLRDDAGRLEIEVARAIVALAGEGGAHELVVATRQLLSATRDLTRAQELKLVALVEHAVATGGAWILRGELAAGRTAGLVDLLAVVPKRGRMPPMTTERAAPWIARYPDALAPALRRLALVDPDAEATAARRLATDLPDPAALRREIAAVRERGLAKRLATLEARLAAPRSPSPARLARLAAKLERAAAEIGLARFRAALASSATARIRKVLGLDAWPAWADRPPVLAVLFALLDLDDGDRRLAGRLLRGRGGEPPWDLRDDPVNAAYLAKMQRAGVDPGPWLDEGVTVVAVKKGAPLALALTADPLEVFQMGAHFETCLAPGGGNFFSVVANAADINKRVLYARRGDAVVGRCLFALTDGFALLAFHPYCHDGDLAFDDVVRDYALELARRMRTTLVPRGPVPTLVARDWYDDGPRDLTGRFSSLETGLAFSVEPAYFISELRRVLERDLDDITLPIVLEHPALHERPELIFPLAPHLFASSNPRSRVAGARLAFQAGDRALADRLLGEHAGAIRLDDHRMAFEAEMLAELRPGVMLARLRATRDRTIRAWKDERADRIMLAGMALDALHRPKQARAMYRLAAPYRDHLTGQMLALLQARGL